MSDFSRCFVGQCLRMSTFDLPLRDVLAFDLPPRDRVKPTKNGPPVVVVIDSSPDTVEMLRTALRPTGIVAFSAMTYDIRDGRIDFEALLRLHSPSVIVYDIAPPYDENWRLCQHLRDVGEARHVPFVLTSTNAAHVEKLAGRAPQIYEIVGKPYDLGLIVEAVKNALNSRPTH
jgi:CheY-like chemotaxis protein